MNSAQRLKEIHQKLLGVSAELRMDDVWANVFGIEQTSPQKEDEVTLCVMALRSEIDLTRGKLDAMGASPGLTSPAFERLKSTAAPGLLHQQWAGYRASILSSDCSKIFEWVDWALRDECEADFSPDEMSELLSELTSLDQALIETEMSPFLRDFVKRQVDVIRAALRVYKVQGIKPLKDAMETVAGTYATQKQSLKTEMEAAPQAAQGVMGKVVNVVEKAAKLVDRVDKVKKAGEAVWQITSSVWTSIQSSWPSGGP
jgi:hypothetical protein